MNPPKMIDSLPFSTQKIEDDIRFHLLPMMNSVVEHMYYTAMFLLIVMTSY